VRIDKKKEIVKDLHEKFIKSKAVIVTDYKGASEETDVALIKDCFKGPSAIALSYDDPIAPAKVLTQFSGEFKKLEIKTGVMGGKVLDLSAIKTLATLPSREELLGQFLSTANGVVSGFVRTLNAIPVQFLNVLQAVKDQKEAG